MNGAPLPPVPDAPPMPLELFLASALAGGLLAALLFFVLVQRTIRLERERDEKLRVTRTAIESHREALIQHLIEMSPGGRKPWQ